ncbi:urea transport system substrate-binding protein [Nitrosospira sp. Nsp2]|uniref:ABC transporter substrate-binding protein n=1 Tax=Nitrosospira sp. Nsp2 TaxID=136548 RepID=UPI000D314CB2|nr:ABC transporter substrate-binding protein [Nitrosospira sp. Nsp2]PTR16046.1 urea transport system substrate-binding protein [Nitrosospira sp. Nsp2]
MKISYKSGVALVLLIVLLGVGFVIWHHNARAQTSIRVGVLHSLSGPMAVSERPLVNAIQLAIDEANASGGINGRKIEARVIDCGSDPDDCAQDAERLITQDYVEALFGCWTSECRKAVGQVVEKHRHLLFYALRYEGMEQSPNIIYGGAVPNQLVMPAVHWALENLSRAGGPSRGGKRVYLAGSDYAFSRVLNVLMKDLLAAHGAEVVGERYEPLKSTAMDDLVADIARQQPDVVLNTISGIDNAAFFNALREQGLTADKVPVLSFSITEVLTAEDTARMAGHFAARNYFQTVPTIENQAFLKRFSKRFGSEAMVDSPAEVSYVNMKMWIDAAREAGSGELTRVQRIILRQSLPAPEGVVSLDPVTRHAWKVARVGRARPDGQFDIVWESGRPLEPSPFPSYRSREEWDSLLKSLGLAGEPKT